MKKKVLNIILKIQIVLGIIILILSISSIFLLYNFRESEIQKNTGYFLDQYQQLNPSLGKYFSNSNDTLFLAKYDAALYWGEKDYIIRQGFIMQLGIIAIVIILSLVLIEQGLIKLGKNK